MRTAPYNVERGSRQRGLAARMPRSSPDGDTPSEISPVVNVPAAGTHVDDLLAILQSDSRCKLVLDGIAQITAGAAG
jgi:hypothetical protein